MIRIKVAKQDDKRAQCFFNRIKDKTNKTLIKTIPDWVDNAVKYTPPDVGKKAISRDLYYRPVVQTYQRALRRQGIKYAVMDTRPKKAIVYGYAKGKRQAKALSLIANRGLAKVSWGQDLTSISATLPVSILRLYGKSPYLRRNIVNDIRIDRVNTNITVNNKYNKMEKFCGVAIRNADRLYNRKLKKALQAELNKKQEKI